MPRNDPLAGVRQRHPHPTKNPPPPGDLLHDLPHNMWPGHTHCENCGWEGWIEDLVDGKYCPDNAKPGHPASARPIKED